MPQAETLQITAPLSKALRATPWARVQRSPCQAAAGPRSRWGRKRQGTGAAGAPWPARLGAAAAGCVHGFRPSASSSSSCAAGSMVYGLRFGVQSNAHMIDPRLPGFRDKNGDTRLCSCSRGCSRGCGAGPSCACLPACWLHAIHMACSQPCKLGEGGQVHVAGPVLTQSSGTELHPCRSPGLRCSHMNVTGGLCVYRQRGECLCAQCMSLAGNPASLVTALRSPQAFTRPRRSVAV